MTGAGINQNSQTKFKNSHCVYSTSKDNCNAVAKELRGHYM